ncbi:MAG: hypothetical protein ACYST9_02410 [Planctomycetota bacterium]|jgi:VanZ family protein
MTFDELQKTWCSQRAEPKLAIDTDLLLKEVRRNKRYFEAAIFWRDVREVGVAIVLGAFFLYFGVKHSFWPMWLLALLCMWVSVFMVVDRVIQKRRKACLSDSLFNCVKSSLAQVNHQVWLLRNILWWYLTPFGIGMIIWFSYCGVLVMTSKNPSIKYLSFILVCIIGTILLYWGIYWLNQRAIRTELAPRKQELEDILSSLKNASV